MTAQPSLDGLLNAKHLREYLAINGLPHDHVEGDMIIDLLRSQQKELLERVRREVIGDDKDWRIQPTKEKTLSERAKWVLRAEQRMKLDAIEREV